MKNEINYADGVMMHLKKLDDGSLEIGFSRKGKTLIKHTKGLGYAVELGPLLEALYWQGEEKPVAKPATRIYDVWSEGFAATGEHGSAVFMGSAQADSFAEACAKVCDTPDRRSSFNSDSLTFWGCQLFDNEADARKSFG